MYILFSLSILFLLCLSVTLFKENKFISACRYSVVFKGISCIWGASQNRERKDDATLSGCSCQKFEWVYLLVELTAHLSTCLVGDKESLIHWLALSFFFFFNTQMKILRKDIFQWRNMNNDLCFVTNALFLSHVNDWASNYSPLISLFNSQTSIPCYNLSHSVKTITVLPQNSWIMGFRCWGEIC